WPVILVIVNLWKNIGYNSIMYYAMIIAIDKTYYEAARVDGAGRWQQILHITLPAIKPTIVILTLMSVGRIMYSDFGLFYQIPMNSGTLLDVTNTIDTYVYRGLMQTNNIGMSAAAGVYQSVVGFILVITANLIVKKVDPESALF
ncbi:MAG: sugar ABC transporter permease, partial [Blautia sp.]|nr:sugar ABC transporter permease [Blautia sp.]